MDSGDILRATWTLYRAHWRHLISIAAVVFVPLGILVGVVASLGWPGVILGNLLNLAAIFLVNGALVKAVEDVRDGRADLSVAQTFGHAGYRLATLAAAGVLAAVGILAGLVLFVVPGLVLLTWWLVLSPVIMLERRGTRDAFARSRTLARMRPWPVFGVVALTLLALLAFAIALGAALAPLGGPTAAVVQSAVGNTLAAPFVAVAWTLTYFALRDAELGGPPLAQPS